MTSAYDTLILGESGLLAYYPFNEPSGATAHDLSSNAYHATISGGVTLGVASLLPNDSETAFTFNGTTGKVLCPSGLSTNGLSAFTFEAWVSPSSVVDQAAVSTNGIPDSNSQGFELYMFAQSFGFEACVGKNSANSGFAQQCNPIFASQVYHLAVVYDGVNLSLYCQGALAPNQKPFTGALFSAHQMSIGYSDAGGAQFFPGTIQKVAYYSVALSQTRIRAHLLAGYATPVSYKTTMLARNPIRYYRLGDTVGSLIAADTSADAIAGTVNSAAHVTFGVTSPLVNDVDTAASFDGSGKITENTTTDIPSAANAPISVVALFNIASLAAQNNIVVVGNMFTGFFGAALLAGGIGTSVGLEAYIPGANNAANATYGAWHLGMITYDGANLFTFIDGLQVRKFTGVGLTLHSATPILAIGVDTNNVGFLTGSLDEIAVCTTALTQADCMALWLAAIGAPAPSSGEALPYRPHRRTMTPL